MNNQVVFNTSQNFDFHSSGVCKIFFKDAQDWNPFGCGVFQGTGFLFGDAARVLTNSHVISPFKALGTYYAYFPNGTVRSLTHQRPIAGNTFDMSKVPSEFAMAGGYPNWNADVYSCLLDSKVLNCHVFTPISRQDADKSGEPRHVIHYPAGRTKRGSYDPIVSDLRKHLSWLENDGTNFSYIADEPTRPGSSGAPLCTSGGKVFGVNHSGTCGQYTIVTNSAEFVSFGVSVEHVMEMQTETMVNMVDVSQYFNMPTRGAKRSERY